MPFSAASTSGERKETLSSLEPRLYLIFTFTQVVSSNILAFSLSYPIESLLSPNSPPIKMNISSLREVSSSVTIMKYFPKFNTFYNIPMRDTSSQLKVMKSLNNIPQFHLSKLLTSHLSLCLPVLAGCVNI